VLSIVAGGHSISAVTAKLVASTISSPASALIDIVPVTLDGTAYGEQKISNGSKSVAPLSKSVAGVVSLTSPSVGLTASTVGGPAARLTSATVGSASLLGLPLPAISGALRFGSSVLAKTADASKAVRVTGFGLPSLRDLLAALGLDISKLPTGTLENLVNKLGLATSAINSAVTAFNAAAVEVSAAQSDVLAKTSAMNAALAVGNGLVSAVPTTITAWRALAPAAQAALVTAVNTASPGSGTAITTADTALTTAQNTLTAALSALTSALSTLTGLLTGALDTPLLSIGELNVGTVADAGGKHVAQVTGSVKGVSVLGTQLIKSTDVISLLSSTLGIVQNKINALTRTVSTVLNGAVSGLTVPAPTISLLQKVTSLSPNGGYQAASAGVVGAAVSWGALHVPVSLLQSPAAAPLVTDPVDMTVAGLTEAARFGPATPTTTTPGTTPTTSNPGLATSGVPAGIAVLAALLMLAGYGVRRLRNAGRTVD
jgi:hypothetical protein